MFDANAKKFAVLGHPIGHSLSPRIHHALFDITGYNGVYTAFDVPPERLAFILPFLREYYHGFNCTIPLKEKIIPHLTSLDARAKWCGSVNTVKVSGDKLYGYSTDGYGLVGALRLCDVTLDGKRVLITGSGGVARVALFEALCRGCHVTIASRNLASAAKLAQDAADNIPAGRANICGLDDIHGSYDILLQCTPVGMHPRPDEMPVKEEVLHRVKVVFDTVYSPRETLLLSRAKACGAKTAGGINMLILQALAAQEIWQGTVFAPDIARQLTDLGKSL